MKDSAERLTSLLTLIEHGTITRDEVETHIALVIDMINEEEEEEKQRQIEDERS